MTRQNGFWFETSMIQQSVCVLLCALLWGMLTDTASAVDVVAVCPERFREALQPWIEHRRGDGLEVRTIESTSNSTRLRRSIAEAADNHTRYVVLIGDAPAIGKGFCDASRQVPTHYSQPKVTALWGSNVPLASDMPMGDLDDDGIPDAVVGRLPVQRAGDLTSFIDRIISYERSNDFGPWRNDVQLIGGVGGFGVVADTAIESVTRTIVTSVLPAETRTTVCYASPGHLFCPKGVSFTDAVVNQYRRGSRFWVYAGHGNVTELDNVPRTRDGVPVLDRSSVSRLDRPAAAAPIALMLACYTGAVDANEDSIAEQMLLTEGGPIAVLAGSRITMPYGNATAAVGLINAVYQEKCSRLGDAWLSTLCEMHADDAAERSPTRLMIDTLATLISPTGTKLVDERREHMRLYNLLGDPTLQMQPPAEVELGVAAGHEVGEPISLKVLASGDLRISLDRPLGSVTRGDPNNTTVSSVSLPVQANEPTVKEIFPAKDVAGPLVIRAIVSGKRSWATGAARTILRRSN